jgi:hypothetical protein
MDQFTDDQLLDICLQVTGSFEGGTPSPTALAGNSDGQGMSVGYLQWNAGQGTLQILIKNIIESIGIAHVQTYFLADMQAFTECGPDAGISFVKLHFLDSRGTLVPGAVATWKRFLSLPESITAQRSLAKQTTLRLAKLDAARFTPQWADRTRAIAFFFDVVTQQGSMSHVSPGPGTSDAAIAVARQNDPACAALWSAVADDLLVEQLLSLAYRRAAIGLRQYMWDTLSRRGTIAARKGIAHETHYDFTDLLD